MNSNLKSIQSRAFAQNPHLRYMWVNILCSTNALLVLSEPLSFVMLAMANVFFFYVRGLRWIKTGRRRMMQSMGTGFWEMLASAITVVSAAHLKRDIHYLPWIIGFQSGPALCAAAEQHGEDALPFSLHSSNAQFEVRGRAAEGRAENKVISLTKVDMSARMTACNSPVLPEQTRQGTLSPAVTPSQF